jgi:hypothetical protein
VTQRTTARIMTWIGHGADRGQSVAKQRPRRNERVQFIAVLRLPLRQRIIDRIAGLET